MKRTKESLKKRDISNIFISAVIFAFLVLTLFLVFVSRRLLKLGPEYAFDARVVTAATAVNLITSIQLLPLFISILT